MNSLAMAWTRFIAGLVLCTAIVTMAPSRSGCYGWPLYSSLLLCAATTRSLAIVCELCFVSWLATVALGPALARESVLVPLVLAYAGWGPSRPIRWLAVLAASAAALHATLPAAHRFGPLAWVTAGCVALTILLAVDQLLAVPPGQLSSIDVVVNSASGNTMHFASQFIAGLEQQHTLVKVHRFHQYRRFHAALDAGALAVAFPIYGAKPPWPFLAWLLRDLPRGRRRPAFVLYTGAIAAENAALLLWLILRVKGWRPCGQSWALYPGNIATFRLGPRRLWSFLDRLIPRRADLANARAHGAALAAGAPAGFPPVVWPTPIFLLGILADNKWVDTILYRNYARRSRCNACGQCVEICPAERLTLVNGLPRPAGPCTVCLACVNVCPHHAMQLRGWTEYGQPYKPRWPGLLVRRGPEA